MPKNFGLKVMIALLLFFAANLTTYSVHRAQQLTVALDGTGDTRTVQEAIDRISENNSRPFVIRIKPGVYKEQIKVPPTKPYVTFVGQNAETTILTFNLSNPQVGSTSASYSTYIGGHDFRAENITFENSFGTGAQAVAILVEADRAVFRNCRFLGWQDTLYAKGGRQYYRDCYIEGHVDFIFGAAAAVFENCHIHSKDAGYITAHMRFDDDEPTGFVFVGCRLTGVNNAKGVFLGRPWRAFARVVFLETEMGAHIRPEGWDNWRDPNREKTAKFGEYKSKGKGGASENRVNWSRQLDRAEAAAFSTISFLKRSDGWNPKKSDFEWQSQKPPLFKSVAWKDSLKQPRDWYATDEATRIADNVLLYQHDNGGWSKHVDMATVLTEKEKATLKKAKANTNTTIDNGATYTQLQYLAKVITAKNIERHKTAFFQGLDFLFAAQYKNGGFPQFFPLRKGYYSHITYNDGAMIGVLKLLRDVAQGKTDFTFVDSARRTRAAEAVVKGIECILRTQVVVRGKKTVWCAQHDEVTLAPAPARAFEPISLSGGESVEIVRFLMSVQAPSREIVEAIEAAVAWFEAAKITGIKWVEKIDPKTSQRSDRVIVEDKSAGPLWARFYDLEQNRPIFVGRDGVIKYSVAEIEAERRNGYEWYVDSAERLLSKDYPAWKKKHGREKASR